MDKPPCGDEQERTMQVVTHLMQSALDEMDRQRKESEALLFLHWKAIVKERVSHE